MTRETFLERIQDVLQTDATLTVETVLADLDEWDSLSMMALMAFVDKNFGIKLGIRDFKAMNTVGDIVAKVGV